MEFLTDFETEQPFTMQMRDDVAVLVDRLFQEKATWPALIKEIRAASGVDISTAEKIALSHEGWRRLCNYLINHDSACRKQAVWHMKHHGPDSLIALISGNFVIIESKVS
ncbi:hypothetical protein [Rhizobium sp. BK376]|uniref:hypothetical protein n=1 Tax=Rhizobium sp. BK376 TaxID=2512149 RepID=UPI001047F019|nr:hypothetical protein [Rhizobium sp. BK376]